MAAASSPQHDASKPAFWSEAQEKQIRGHFAERITNKEQSGTQAVDRGAEMQIAVHAKRGKADVDAIHVGEAIADGNDWEQAEGGFALGRGTNGGIAMIQLESDC